MSVLLLLFLTDYFVFFMKVTVDIPYASLYTLYISFIGNFECNFVPLQGHRHFFFCTCLLQLYCWLLESSPYMSDCLEAILLLFCHLLILEYRNIYIFLNVALYAGLQNCSSSA